MKLTDEEKELLKNDIKFCRNKEAYCLGSTFEDAAEVIRTLIELKKKEDEEDD